MILSKYLDCKTLTGKERILLIFLAFLQYVYWWGVSTELGGATSVLNLGAQAIATCVFNESIRRYVFGFSNQVMSI